MSKALPLAALPVTLVATLLATTACESSHRSTGRDTAVVQAPTADHELRRIGDVLWYTDIDVAAEVARATGKPLWMHFGEDPG